MDMDSKKIYKYYAEIYDLVYPSKNDANFYVTQAKKLGGPVLELGCGTGRVLIQIAREGMRVTGLDLSRDMLNLLMKKIQKEKFAKNIELIEGDMRDFYIPKKFRLAIMPFRPFQHMLTRKDQEKCIRNIYKHLDKNGLLIMDIFNPDLSKPENVVEHHITATDEEGNLLTKSGAIRFDKKRQILKVRFYLDKISKDKRVERKIMGFEMSYLFEGQLKELLEKNGFRVLNVYGDFDGSEFREGSKEIIVIAKKI